MKRSAAVVAAASVVTTLFLLEACGLDDTVVEESGGNGSQTDATTGADGTSSSGDGSATVDTGPKLLPDGAVDPGDDAAVALDAGDAAFPDATASDGGGCPTGQSLCGTGTSATCVTNCDSQCTGSPLSCSQPAGGAACVANCAACGTSTSECFRCEASSSFAAVGTCESPANSGSCVKAGYLHCACFGYNLSSCPGATEVCRPTFIPGVGVCKTCGETNSDGQSCKGGGKCDTATDTCH